MSSAKNTTAAKKKNAKAGKRPGETRNTAAVAAGSTVPAKSEPMLPARSEPKALAKRDSPPPAQSEAGLPVKKEAQLPAVQTVPTRKADASAKGGLGENPYLPEVATVAERIQETALIVTLRLVLDDSAKMHAFTFKPGQVGQLSVFGAGEATFVINSPPSQKNYLQMSVMKAGEVTSAIHKLAAGDKVGLRAPLGNSFPYEQWKGKEVFFIGGGIGMAPIRTIMLHLLDNRQAYGKISLLYGARSPKDMAYGYELDGWLHSRDLDATLTIDAPFEGWNHRVGLIPNVLLDLAPKPENSIAVLCGPPIMIKFTLQALQKLGFPDERIFTTLEKRMKCGIGICGRCNIGHKYVCVDGPVFSLAELKELPDEL
jgi:NAD(P)H-flavin reductase